jgi:hypothetical protein
MRAFKLKRLLFLAMGFVFLAQPAFSREQDDEFDAFLPIFGVEPQDRIRWHFPDVPSRIVVIGDIHGDLNSLVLLLRQSGLVTGKKSEWSGGRSHLVLLGDLIDRGADSKAVMLYVQRLSEEAKISGGAVHALLGNHELLAAKADFRATKAEIDSFQRGSSRDKWEILNWFYRQEKGPFANWIASRNSIVQIGPYVFVHGGLGAWVLDHDIGEVNASVRSWIRYFQGNGRMPSEQSAWVIDDDYRSPLWSRSMSSSSGLSHILFPGDLFQRMMDKLKAAHVFIGHSVTYEQGFRIGRDHPLFGDRLIEMDTGVSYAVGGKPSALIIEGGKMREIYPARKRKSYWITKKLRNICAEDIRWLVKRGKL